MKNKLIIIGIVGDKRCYLNIDAEEAKDLYLASSPLYGREDLEVCGMIEVLEFDSSFDAYEIYGAKNLETA